MQNKYDNIQQLINFWQQYEETTGNTDFCKFGLWLSSDTKKSKISFNEHKIEKDIKDLGTKLPEQFVFIFIKLNRYLEFYSKKFFEGLIINNITEFAFLYTANKEASMKKSEIINRHQIEYTTGIDIIKRLIKLGVMEEARDELDKRSKRITITSEGKKVLIEALIRMNKIYDVFFKGFGPERLEPVISVLSDMQDMHSRIHNEHGDKSYFDLIKVFSTLNNT